MYSVKILNPKKDEQQVWFIGPHVSAWTYQLLFDIPIVNRIREENPDVYIIAGGYIGEDFYYRDINGKSTIDAYIEYQPDNMIRKETGLNHAKYDNDIYKAKDIAETHFGSIDKALLTPLVDNEWLRHIAGQYPRTHYRLGTFAPPPMDTGEYVIVHSKFSNLWKGTTNSDSIAGVTNADVQLDYDVITELSKTYRVYITGMPGECHNFDIPNVISLVNIPPAYKAPILLSLMNNAVAFISTMATSVTTMAMLTGCPTIQFNAKRYMYHWAGTSGNSRLGGWNPFGTFSRHFQQSAMMPPEQRLKEIRRFITDSKDTHAYCYDIVRVDDNLLESWDKKGIH